MKLPVFSDKVHKHSIDSSKTFPGLLRAPVRGVRHVVKSFLKAFSIQHESSPRHSPNTLPHSITPYMSSEFSVEYSDVSWREQSATTTQTSSSCSRVEDISDTLGLVRPVFPRSHAVIPRQSGNTCSYYLVYTLQALGINPGFGPGSVVWTSYDRLDASPSLGVPTVVFIGGVEYVVLVIQEIVLPGRLHSPSSLVPTATPMPCYLKSSNIQMRAKGDRQSWRSFKSGGKTLSIPPPPQNLPPTPAEWVSSRSTDDGGNAVFTHPSSSSGRQNPVLEPVPSSVPFPVFDVDRPGRTMAETSSILTTEALEQHNSVNVEEQMAWLHKAVEEDRISPLGSSFQDHSRVPVTIQQDVFPAIYSPNASSFQTNPSILDITDAAISGFVSNKNVRMAPRTTRSFQTNPSMGSLKSPVPFGVTLPAQVVSDVSTVIESGAPYVQRFGYPSPVASEVGAF